MATTHLSQVHHNGPVLLFHFAATLLSASAACAAEPSPQQVVRLADTASDEPLARVYSPRILAPGIADTYSLRTFAQFDRWRDLSGDARAYEVYRYLADTHTGLFHMNVVAEGEDALSEFVEVRDPVKIRPAFRLSIVPSTTCLRVRRFRWTRSSRV